MYLTVAEQIFMLEEKIKKRRTHFLLKDVYDYEFLDYIPRFWIFVGLASAENLKNEYK